MSATAPGPGSDLAPGAPADEPLLRIVDVHKWFAETHVLRGIDLVVNAGEIVALIGPSGSGKSTLLRCINHLEERDAGTVHIDGRLVGFEMQRGVLYRQRERALARERQRMGMVFQHFNLFAHMTAAQNVAYGQYRVLRRSRAEARRTAAELLDRVGLGDKLDAYPAQLSGGQQQRVAIARSLALDPALLLFDEPTSALDAELVGEVLAVIRDLAEQGMTMVIVTHEISFAREVADVVAFMADGRIVERGTAAAVIDSPSHPRTIGFLRRINSA